MLEVTTHQRTFLLLGGEPYPRGQLSALMMLSEAGEAGAWARVFREKGQRRRFAEPTVEGIDYPNLGVNQAWNDPGDGVLHVATFAATPSRRGTPTSFRITKLANACSAAVYRDGALLYPRWRAIGADTIEIETEVGEQQFRIETRRRLAGSTTDTGGAAMTAPCDVESNPGAVTGSMSGTDRTYQPAAPTRCSCC
jgi:hypothetical protein